MKLSDFDSVKTFQGEELLAWHQEWWPYVGMSPEECEQVMGTPGYRAPEVCDLCTVLLGGGVASFPDWFLVWKPH